MIKEVYHTFCEILSPFGRVVLAGGSVRDSLMDRDPKDYDIFILGGSRIAFGEMGKKVTTALAKFPKIQSATEWHKSEPFMIYEIEYEGKGVQVMYKEELWTTDSLLDGFDWNVSLFAFDENGYRTREHVDNIAVGKSLRLQGITHPASTLRRGYRFSERFKMKFENSDVARLCEMVAFNNNKRIISSI
jgi:hypothetical protein